MKKISLFIMLFVLSFLNGCLKDLIIPPVSSEFENSAEILFYLEENGDYINSPQVPSIIEAEEVYNNLNNYLILDIRSKFQFDKGHIENAVNLPTKDLIVYLNENNGRNYLKVVVVSATGQAAAFYNCLLRLYGFENTYSMDFGMASWNSDFSTPWEESNVGFMKSSFDNTYNPKPAFTELPKISFKNSNSSITEKLNERINILLEENFIDSAMHYVETSPSIGLQTITKSYNSSKKIFEGYYFLFFGENSAYYYSTRSGTEAPIHPRGAVYYESGYPISDLRSSAFLQTIQNNKINIVYSFSGQRSAYAAAYLRVLGYDARSQLFGTFWLDPFLSSQRNEFPYITK